MKTQAAILWELNAPWSVEEIELDPPGPGEVLVKLAASGMCHSDEHLVTGDLPFELPMIGGHEGAGVDRAGRRRGQLAGPGRSRRVRVHPVVWAMRELFDRTPEPVRPRRPDRALPPGRRDVAPPRSGQGPRDHVHPRDLRPPHRRQRGQLHQARPRRAARSGVSARLWCRHRLGFERLRRRVSALATSSRSSASVASGSTPCRALVSPAPSRSGRSTRWSSSAPRLRSSARPTRRRRSKRRSRRSRRRRGDGWPTRSSCRWASAAVSCSPRPWRSPPSAAGSSSPTSTQRWRPRRTSACSTSR